MNDQTTTRRAYRQEARAHMAEATGNRILDAFCTRLRDSWFEEITLDAVAQDAGVTVQTVLRRFGGKQGLLDAVPERMKSVVLERRGMRPGDIDQSIEFLIQDYESSGDFVMRLLAQEERHAAIKEFSDFGRAGHRQWIRESFGPWLAGMNKTRLEETLDALVVATDVYVWKLVRRDMKRPTKALKQLMTQMIHAALDGNAAKSGIAPKQGKHHELPEE